MNPTREQLLSALADMSNRYPEWRLGQMIANLTFFAKEPKTQAEAAEAAWDIEDEELLAIIRDHLQRRRQACLPDDTPALPASLS